MNAQTVKTLGRVLALACTLSVPSAMMAQSTTKAAANDSPSRWDIFAGYSYLAPKDTVQTLLPNGTTMGFPYKSFNKGAIESVAYYLNKNFGVEAIGDEHMMSSQDMSGASIGPIYRFPSEDITPFIHGLVGVERIGGPYNQPDKWGMVVTAGGGLDYQTPWFNRHLSIRVFEADFQYMHDNWGPGVYGGRANVKAARLSTGVVFHIGNIAPPPAVTMACTASPESVYAGDPVSVEGTAGNLNPKEHAIYSWSGEGVTGKDSKATVDTANLAPGTYTVKCGVKQGKPGKEGLKPWQSASGSTSFTVKPFEPPTLTCSADPAEIKPDGTSTITAMGMSPQNRPLTYSYSASAGNIGGSGTSTTYSSVGAPSGPVEITCNVSDDKGHTATANTTVTIEAPPPPPSPSPEQIRLEHRLALHSIFFPTARPSERYPNGGLVESQQGTLTTLASDFKSYLHYKPDAQLILTGHTDPRGSAKFNQALSERRVNRVKAFLVQQGIPASSIQTSAVGEEHQLTADEVKSLVEENTDLTSTERQRILHNLRVIVLAQNRRVDVTLSTTGQKSVKLYPFNAEDASTLLSQKPPAPKRRSNPVRHHKR